jgi:hypothetical protein
MPGAGRRSAGGRGHVITGERLIKRADLFMRGEQQALACYFLVSLTMRIRSRTATTAPIIGQIHIQPLVHPPIHPYP